MDEIANILTDIKNLLEKLLDSHPCKNCKTLVVSFSLECSICHEKDP